MNLKNEKKKGKQNGHIECYLKLLIVFHTIALYIFFHFLSLLYLKQKFQLKKIQEMENYIIYKVWLIITREWHEFSYKFLIYEFSLQTAVLSQVIT